MSVMQAIWQRWNTRFSTLKPREKGLIAVAVAVIVLLGGHSLWIEPALLQEKQLRSLLAQQGEEGKRLEEQRVALTNQSSDPDATNRAALQRLQAELAMTERELENFGHTLISPAEAPALLQRVLARHRGLTLLSLKTLPPRPLIEIPTDEAGKTSGSRQVPAQGNLYQHGIEIKVAGGYHDLLAYVAELDAGPQRLLRGKLDLVVKQYPVSELTLTVYTLSLDTRWFVV